MVDRRRRKNPKRERLFVRLTTEQLELLRRYIDLKDLNSEAEGIRMMIDGLEDWLNRQSSNRGLAGTAPVIRSSMPPVPSGLPRPSDVAASDVAASDVDSDVAASDVDSDAESRPVGDFGGRPSIRLPKASWNDGINDE